MLDPATARLCVWRLPLEAAFRLFSKLGSLGGSIRERFSRTGRTRPALARPAFSRWLLENDRLRERWPCQWLNVLYFPFSETSPDSHTPETSYSGAIHGMPLACLLGRGDKRLLNIGLTGAQLSAAHTVVLGPRSYEPEELDFLRDLGVRIYDTETLMARGFAACLDEAIALVASAPAGFGVTLDLDAIDPLLAPGVGSPEPDGLPPQDVLSALHRISVLPGLCALEIVEYNPDRDRHGVTAGLIAELISEILP